MPNADESHPNTELLQQLSRKIEELVQRIEEVEEHVERIENLENRVTAQEVCVEKGFQPTNAERAVLATCSSQTAVKKAIRALSQESAAAPANDDGTNGIEVDDCVVTSNLVLPRNKMGRVCKIFATAPRIQVKVQATKNNTVTDRYNVGDLTKVPCTPKWPVDKCSDNI